jgi:hypothetical protein
MLLYSCVVFSLFIDVSYMFLIHLRIHTNSHTIKEGERIQRRDKANLKYRRQEENTRNKDNNKREQRQKTTLTPLKPGMNSGAPEV